MTFVLVTLSESKQTFDAGNKNDISVMLQAFLKSILSFITLYTWKLILKYQQPYIWYYIIPNESQNNIFWVLWWMASLCLGGGQQLTNLEVQGVVKDAIYLKSIWISAHISSDQIQISDMGKNPIIVQKRYTIW